MIKFMFNKKKAIEVILYLANKRPSIDKMSLYKFLFFADKEHLNKYGRPICGGHYVAMVKGPVPSEISDILKKEKRKEFVIDEYWITALRKADESYLSKTDMEMLDLVYGRYSNLSANELSNLSHKHRAWTNAVNKNTSKNNNTIDYRDMIDDCNQELMDELEENSEFIQI